MNPVSGRLEYASQITHVGGVTGELGNPRVARRLATTAYSAGTIVMTRTHSENTKAEVESPE